MRHCSPALVGHERGCVRVHQYLDSARLSGAHFSPSPNTPLMNLFAPALPVAHPRGLVAHNGRHHFGVSCCARASEEGPS